MRVSFVKQSDEQHALEVVREDGRREHVVCETRSYFLHDLLHFAVESEGALTGGFWGRLAQGMTLAEMNDRKRPVGPESAELAAIEQLVGACTERPRASLPKSSSPAFAVSQKLSMLLCPTG